MIRNLVKLRMTAFKIAYGSWRNIVQGSLLTVVMPVYAVDFLTGSVLQGQFDNSETFI